MIHLLFSSLGDLRLFLSFLRAESQNEAHVINVTYIIIPFFSFFSFLVTGISLGDTLLVKKFLVSKFCAMSHSFSFSSTFSCEVRYAHYRVVSGDFQARYSLGQSRYDGQRGPWVLRQTHPPTLSDF